MCVLLCAVANNQENSMTSLLEVQGTTAAERRSSLSSLSSLLSSSGGGGALLSRQTTFRPVVASGAGAAVYCASCQLLGATSPIYSCNLATRKRRHDDSDDDAVTSSDDDEEIRTILSDELAMTSHAPVSVTPRHWTQASRRASSDAHRPSLNLYKMQVNSTSHVMGIYDILPPGRNTPGLKVPPSRTECCYPKT